MSCDYPKQFDVSHRIRYLRGMLKSNLEQGKYDEAKEVNIELCTIMYCDGQCHHRIVSNGESSNTTVSSNCPYREADMVEHEVVAGRRRPSRDWSEEKKRIEGEMGGI